MAGPPRWDIFKKLLAAPSTVQPHQWPRLSENDNEGFIYTSIFPIIQLSVCNKTLHYRVYLTRFTNIFNHNHTVLGIELILLLLTAIKEKILRFRQHLNLLNF